MPHRGASAPTGSATDSHRRASAAEEREAFRQIFHLFFAPGRRDLPDVVKRVALLSASVHDPALQRKVERYVAAFEARLVAERWSP